MNNFGIRKKVRTRKEHKCLGCLETIVADSNVTYYSGKFEGQMYSFHFCDLCDNFCNKNRDYLEDGFTAGDIGVARKGVYEKIV